MKNILYAIQFVFLLTLFSCNNENNTKSLTENNSPITVEVKNLTRNNSNSFSLSGKVITENTAHLSTRIMGYITKVNVEVGETVSKGDLLINIKSADITAKKAQVEASIIEAEAAYINAEKDYLRFKELLSKNSATQKEFDDVTTQYNMAKAHVHVANQMRNEVDAMLSYANITAPFDGIITAKNSSVGNMANPGVALLTIESAGIFEIETLIPENQILNVKKGDKVEVRIDATTKKYNGQIYLLNTSTQNTGSQYLAKIKLDISKEEMKNIRSGMYAQVAFPSIKNDSETIGKVVIPKSSLINKGQLQGLFIVTENNEAIIRWVRLGSDFGDTVEILSGLDGTEKIVVMSETKLNNGSKVQY